MKRVFLHIKEWVSPAQFTGKGGYQELFRIAYPLLFLSASNVIMQFVDRKFLGNSSTEEMAASMPSASMINSLTIFFLVTANFSNALISQLYGAMHFRECVRVVWTAFYFALMSAGLMLIYVPLIGYWFMYSKFMSANLADLGWIYFLSLLPACMFHCMGAPFFCFYSGRGKTIPVAAINIFVCLLNILLDWLLIFGHWGFPRMGILGAGIATSASLMTGFFIILGMFLSVNQKVYPTRREFAFSKDYFLRLVKFGTPSGLQVLSNCASFTVIILLVGQLGDMALAALIRKVEERDDFVFDNYASFLERNPAARHAELHQGEESRGTSWSCSHGVSRWYKDCGCHTGGDEGWNQAWRTPLRNALTHLGEKLDSVFSDEIKKIFGTSVKPEDILHLAGKEFIGELSMREFIELLHKEYGFASSYDVELAHLLSGIKNKHFSFTSCGFFFSDISGIEPRQDIKYALYAIKMFQPYSQGDLLFPFLSELRHAKSNIKAQGDGMNIAQEEMKGLPGEAEASLYFFLNRTLARKEDWMNSYGRFVLAHMDIDEAENYSSDIIDTVTLELYRFTVLSSSSIDNGINLYLCENDQDNNPVNRLRITNQDIPDRMLDEIYTWLDRSMTRVTFSELSELANDMRFFSMLVKNSRYVPLETMVLENLGLTLKIIKALFSSHSDMDIFRRREILGNMIDFIRKCGRDSDIASINSILSAHSERLAAAVNEKGLDDTISDAIIDLLDLARAHGFEPVTKNLQNAVYPYYSGQKKAECGNEKLRNTTLALNFQ